MTPIDFNCPAAFSPFFDDAIVVEGVRSSADGGRRKVQGTFSACVLDTGFAEPLMEGDADSDVRTYSVSIRSGDWVDGTKPQVGDRVRLADGTQLAVSRTDNLLGEIWSLTAREVS
jgi:hypothetical protein